MTAASPAPSHDDFEQRKLWIEYLSRLISRDAESQQRSGATNWVLLGFASAVGYHFVRSFDSILEVPYSLKWLLVASAFLLNVVANGASSISTLMKDIEDPRGCPPEATGTIRRATLASVSLWMIVATGSVFAWRQPELPMMLRSISLISGIYLSLAILVMCSGYAYRAYQEYRYETKIPIHPPRTSSVGNALTHIVLLIVSAMQIGMLLKWMVLNVGNWSRIVTLAIDLAIVSTIALILYLRGLRGNTRSRFAQLERDILLDNLAPSEIRSRFIREVAGSTPAEWVEEVKNLLAEVAQDMMAIEKALGNAIAEINEISPKFLAERTHRACRVLDVVAKILNTRSAMIFPINLRMPIVAGNMAKQFQSENQSAKDEWNSFTTAAQNFIDQLEASMEPLKKIGSPKDLRNYNRAVKVFLNTCKSVDEKRLPELFSATGI